MTMRGILGRVCLAVVVVIAAGQANAGERAEAERKAERLERAVVEEGSPSPTPGTTLTAPEAQAVDPAGEAPLEDALTCLARTLYWEARGERKADREAVASVVMNRLGHEGFPSSVCEVVRQGSEQGACQFSWWCDGRPDDAAEEEAYANAKEIARRALNGQLEDRTDGALYFHQTTVAPPWAAEYRRTAQVGPFVFYRPHGGTAR